jgi:hypothetical protein
LRVRVRIWFRVRVRVSVKVRLKIRVTIRIRVRDMVRDWIRDEISVVKYIKAGVFQNLVDPKFELFNSIDIGLNYKFSHLP